MGDTQPLLREGKADDGAEISFQNVTTSKGEQLQPHVHGNDCKGRTLRKAKEANGVESDASWAKAVRERELQRVTEGPPASESSSFELPSQPPTPTATLCPFSLSSSFLFPHPPVLLPYLPLHQLHFPTQCLPARESKTLKRSFRSFPRTSPRRKRSKLAHFPDVTRLFCTTLSQCLVSGLVRVACHRRFHLQHNWIVTSKHTLYRRSHPHRYLRG